MRIASTLLTVAGVLGLASPTFAFGPARSFNRVATFPVYLNTDVDEETVAEIVAATEDGMTLVYTDGAMEGVGFVDLADPADPQPAGFTELGGEPTSVAIVGGYALVAVNSSADFVNVSGQLAVVDVATQSVAHVIELGGQPDSVALSPDGRYAAVAIENERDEDIVVDEVEGGLPQLPAGLLVVIELDGAPTGWGVHEVDLTGIADYAPEDPEPEFVDINEDNVAAVTLQENNHVVLVDLATRAIVGDFNCGEVDLDQIDTEEEDLIDPIYSLLGVPREPDAVTWIGDDRLATADEGDLFGGGRGFTIFDTAGGVLYTSGNEIDHTAMRVGHYPEGRSGNKGSEPESVEYARYGFSNYLFVGSERASVIFVYRMILGHPCLVQVLPAGFAPEGVVAIPQRNLFVAASEHDSRDDGYRSSVSIYKLERGAPMYPTIVSANRADGAPIPWAALSGLTFGFGNTLYSVYDSAYIKSRIFRIDAGRHPAVITGEIVMTDDNGKVAAIDPGLVNEDGTVNVDPEGISTGARGFHFWVASEGAGTVGDEKRPFEFPNLILKVAPSGEILDVVELPAELAAVQLRFGLEGVVAVREGLREILYVPFQRAWGNAGDPSGRSRIGRYDTRTGEWTFIYYPLDAPTSPMGGWVGLSGIEYAGDGKFLILERDNQANTDARVKLVTEIDTKTVTFRPNGQVLDVVEKTVVSDLLADGILTEPGGAVLEKIEGIARRGSRTVIVNDNDGVDDSNGETLLLEL